MCAQNLSDRSTQTISWRDVRSTSCVIYVQLYLNNGRARVLRPKQSQVVTNPAIRSTTTSSVVDCNVCADSIHFGPHFHKRIVKLHVENGSPHISQVNWPKQKFASDVLSRLRQVVFCMNLFKATMRNLRQLCQQ